MKVSNVLAAIAAFAAIGSAQAQEQYFSPAILGTQSMGIIESVENCEIVGKANFCDVYGEDGNGLRLDITQSPKGTIKAGDRVAAMRLHHGTFIVSMIIVNGESFPLRLDCEEDTPAKKATKFCQQSYPG